MYHEYMFHVPFFILVIYKYMAMILYLCIVEKIWVIWTHTYTQWQKKRLRGWRGNKIGIVSRFDIPWTR